MSYTSKFRKILIVDDEPTVQEILYCALQDRGHEVFVASSLQAAREALERHPVSLVITDICLSRASPKEGLELLQYLRQHRPQTGVIAMSADLSPEVLDKARGLGAMHCFEKPFDPAEIMHFLQGTEEAERQEVFSRPAERTGGMAVGSAMKTILVVDDEATSLAHMELILSWSGYRVIAKSHAPSALALIRDGLAVDLVITDYCMPDMDGLEFLNGLRKIFPAVPLIMVTGHGDIESYLKAINLGAFDYLNKPVTAKELDCVVRAALQSAQAA